LSTTFTFDAELSHGESGKDLELERLEVFSLVDVGQTTLRLMPSDKLASGARLRLSVRFKDGAAPSRAAFTLVVHPVQAEALEAQAQGLYTLKLWEPSTGRTVILSGISFP